MSYTYDNTYMQQRLEQAIQYLRSRNKYVTEFSFVPTNAAQTDVKKTIKKYLKETQVQTTNKDNVLTIVKKEGTGNA